MTYQHWKSLPKPDWKTEPISCTCEVFICHKYDGFKKTPIFCGGVTVKAYPAWGKGWQTLCAIHSKKHPEAFDVYELISNGETWK